jgi:hypothetical protein
MIDIATISEKFAWNFDRGTAKLRPSYFDGAQL